MCGAAEGAAIARQEGASVTQLWEVPPPTGSAEDAMKGEVLSVLALVVSEGPLGGLTVGQYRGRMAHSMVTRNDVELST